MTIMPVFWLLGLSGSGKTVLGSPLRLYLESQEYRVSFLDADHFCSDGHGREENLRRIDCMRECALDAQEQGKISIVSAITPYASMREMNRRYLPRYREIWVRCSPSSLCRRKYHGLSPLTEKDINQSFSGISEDFEEPKRADFIIDTDREDLASSYVTLRDEARSILSEGRDCAEKSRLSRLSF